MLLIESSSDESSVVEFLLADSKEASSQLSLLVASRVSTGCHKLATERFDVVLLDLSFPPDSGIEAFRKVHERQPDVPIVVLASPSEEQAARQAVRLGAQDCLVRGCFNGRELWLRLSYAVERSRWHSQLEGLLMSDSISRIVVDREGVVRFANESARAFLNRKAGDLEGKPFGHGLPSSGAADLELEVAKRGRRIAEVRCAEIDWRGAPSRLVTLVDVTDARDFDRLKSDLASNLKAVEAKDQLINGVSHEMRNPLTIVKTALYALKNRLAGPLTPQQDKFIDMAARNVDRQIRMVENVLDLGRIRSDKTRLQLRSVELGVLVAQLAEEFHLTNASPRLELEFPKDMPAVFAEPDLVSQVVRNLLDNAFRFAKDKVTVKASVAGEQLLVTVIDDGVGIPKEHLGELFNQYVQVHRPSGGGYKGTGLGLAISREIVVRHGGRIWVESVFGKGSRFNFTLPLASTVTPASNNVYRPAMAGVARPG